MVSCAEKYHFAAARARYAAAADILGRYCRDEASLPPLPVLRSRIISLLGPAFSIDKR